MPSGRGGRPWRRIRAAVLARDRVCHWCGSAPATEADHLIPVALGGTDDLANLVGACRPCNNRRGARTRSIKAAARRGIPEPKADPPPSRAW